MGGFGLFLLTAFAMLLVIEGLLWALFPALIRRMMAFALTQSTEKLRFFGFSAALAGAALLWALRAAPGH